ncbi:cell division protein FtsQ/DivIB [Fusobacterium sp. MFO224]|uniref:cell division protein FtsQ/DivIB n=1 Tax=Fusobacterium sp. MFO224 TaxID=3378070 RepID=UPI003854399A
MNFLNKDIFKIRSVSIEGAENQLYIKLKKMEKDLFDKNINFIDFIKLEKTILKDKRIEKININTKELGILSLEVKEKEINYYLQYKKEIYLLDKNGEICGRINDKRVLDVPIICVDSKEEILPLIILMKKIEKTQLQKMLSQIYMDGKYCINMILLDGTIIKTNLEVDPKKYYISECLYLNLSKWRKIEYIDIRFKDYVLKYMEDKNGK